MSATAFINPIMRAPVDDAAQTILIRERQKSRMLRVWILAGLFFYAAGLMYGKTSNLLTAEYWRWWMVHLWVEGFFEVFATVGIAFLFTRLNLLEIRSATRGALSSGRGVIYSPGPLNGETAEGRRAQSNDPDQARL